MPQFTMVGANFRPTEAKDIIKQLEIGDVCQLEADPKNEYDDNAVKVLYDDVFIGFVPKTDNSALAEAFREDEDLTVTATIIAFESTLKPVLEYDFDGEPGDEDRYGALGQG